MKNNFTEIVAIIDRSGSMDRLSQDTIGGFNSFISEQKKLDGDATATLVLFDDRYNLLYEGIDIQEVPELTDKEYFARGTTALLDAVGKTIKTVGGRLNQLDESEKPDKVLFLITTDGIENASYEYSRKQIAKLVKEQEDKYSWEFVFLGANIDSFAEGGAMGYRSNNTMNFDATSKGVADSYMAINMKTSSMRGVGEDKSMEDYMADVQK